MAGIQYKHIKSGKIYDILFMSIINATNAQDGEKLVIYRGMNREGTQIKTFAREHNEFMVKFKRVE